MALLSCAFLIGCAASPSTSENYVAGDLIQLNDNGAWSWFSSPRAIIHKGRLIVGSVRAVGTYRGNRNDPDWGNVEISVLDIEQKKAGKTILHRHFEQDDHDNPAFLVLPDDRVLAVYTRHGAERKIFMRTSTIDDPLSWSEATEIVTPGKDARILTGDNATYSNLFRMPGGRIYNFYRGFGYDPNYMFSDDNGTTWQFGGRLFEGRNGYGPYVKYAFDGKETLHFLATEDHPRRFDNSLYHGVLRDGVIYDSYGKKLCDLSKTTDAPIKAWEFTKIFAGDADQVAWMCDIRLDRDQHPYIAFSVQKDGRGLPVGQGGMDHRYYYGRFDGSNWHTHEMAFAGMRLYPNEDDYTGLVALHPNDPNTLYLSTNADPVTGEPLISAADQKRHWELFRGTTRDRGKTWHWQPITANSTVDNIRPIIPDWDDPRTALVWMRGGYRSNRGEWDTSVVAMIMPPG